MALPQRYVEKDFYTEAEYLAWEEDAPYKSEYVNGRIIPLHGEIRAMSGGTSDHGVISANIIGTLWVALKGGGCRVLTSDIKLHSGDGSLRYPDVSVVCGEIKYHGRGRIVMTNPLVLVEVLSPSTEIADRGEKMLGYQSIDSLQSYLLVDQYAARLEQYARKENGHWDYQVVEGREGVVTIPALQVTLSLSDIYDGIEFGDKRDG